MHALRSQAGVKHIVLAVNYRAEVLASFLSKIEEQYKITVSLAHSLALLLLGVSQADSSGRSRSPSLSRTSPSELVRLLFFARAERLRKLTHLTFAAGPLALARDILGKDDAPFFVLNSDVTCT